MSPFRTPKAKDNRRVSINTNIEIIYLCAVPVAIDVAKRIQDLRLGFYKATGLQDDIVRIQQVINSLQILI